MSYVLTVSSTVACPHSPGQVSLSSDTKLTVGGKKVLVLASVNGASVSGCTQVTNTSNGTQQCSTVTTASGTASKLQAGGAPVVLDTLTGATDGFPPTPSTLSVSAAGQSKLTAS
jgi:hypothetical protein